MLALALVSAMIFILTFFPLLKWYRKRSKFVALIEKIPGPKAYPIIGTTYFDFFTPREEQFNVSVQHRRQYPNILRYWYGQEAAVSLYKAEYVEVILTQIFVLFQL